MDTGRADGPSRVMPGPAALTGITALEDPSRAMLVTIRAVAATAGVVAVGTLLIGLALDVPRVAFAGILEAAYAAFMLVEISRPASRFGEQVVIRMSLASMVTVGAIAVLMPTMGTALAVTAILPVVVALPFASPRSTILLMAASGVIAVLAWVAGSWLPGTSRLPGAIEAGMALVILVCSVVFLLIFLWIVSRRLKDTAADLRSVVTMSSDLARSLDPQLVGDGIARHIASAVGSDDCALSYWDRDSDRVVTLGFHPPERRSSLADSYALDDYPMTKLMLTEQSIVVVDVGDKTADPSERAYLTSLGQRSMLMLPLVASGTTIGLIELTSSSSSIFDARHIELAAMLAREAAMGLENARLYDKIRHQAFHDGLTGLKNRLSFRDHVEVALAESTKGAVAVLFVDLDDFKDVNDRFGHDQGDEVLVEVGRRIQASLREGDMAARFGGDEFAVLLAQVPDERVAVAVAGRILEEMRRPFLVGTTHTYVGASIGVALSGTTHGAVDDLLQNADVAMYAAKMTARGQCETFRPELRDAVVARAELAARLRGADTRGELRVEYQPIVGLETRELVSLEALVRWQVPGHPLTMPAEFIGLAESTGEIIPIGRWVLREACRQVRDWQIRLGLPHLEISVNLSARQFQDKDLVETVREALSDAGLEANHLILELTESALMQDTESTLARLAELRTLGVRLAIDDFGTGYSSLAYLQRFAVDVLKIDRSFIAGLSSRPDQPVLVSAIVELARALSLDVIAEGIERQDQLEALLRMGCHQGQGYLFGAPQPPSSIEPFLVSAATSMAAERPAGQDRRRAGARSLRLVAGDERGATR